MENKQTRMRKEFNSLNSIYNQQKVKMVELLAKLQMEKEEVKSQAISLATADSMLNKAAYREDTVSTQLTLRIIAN